MSSSTIDEPDAPPQAPESRHSSKNGSRVPSPDQVDPSNVPWVKIENAIDDIRDDEVSFPTSKSKIISSKTERCVVPRLGVDQAADDSLAPCWLPADRGLNALLKSIRPQ